MPRHPLKRISLALALVASLGTALMAGQPPPLPSARCPALIRGVLWWIHPQHDQLHLKETLDAMEAVGMNCLWLLGTKQLAADPENTLLERIYTEADRRGWKVMIETSSVHRWHVTWDIPKLLEIEKKRIALVASRYAQHRSFYAWYINYEIYMQWGEQSTKIRALYHRIGQLTRQATPRAKLAISPFYIADQQQIRDRFRYATPAEYGQWWEETIRQAGIDIVMLQDSGAVHCECVPLETRVAFFTAMQQACQANRAELWGNVETVEKRAADWQDYARRLKYSRQTGSPYPWSFDMTRNAWKLDLASRFSSNIVAWGWEYWNPANPQSNIGTSRQNYDAYKKYYEGIIHWEKCK